MTDNHNCAMTSHDRNSGDEDEPLRKSRTIRSFVRREGRITTAQRRALDTLLTKYEVSSTDQSGSVRQHFDDPHQPLCIEIGFGNGGALLEMANERPDWNFIGVEVYRPGVGKLLLGVEKLALRNIRVSTDDATSFLKEQVEAATADAIYVFFPDPWPKKKHLKRRLINQYFLDLIVDRLKPGGHLHIATDIDSYAEQVRELLALQSRLVISNASSNVPARPMTKYENRGKRLGHQIHDIIRQKRPS